MDNEIMIHMYNEILFRCEENEIMKFSGKYTGQEKIILNNTKVVG